MLTQAEFDAEKSKVLAVEESASPEPSHAMLQNTAQSEVPSDGEANDTAPDNALARIASALSMIAFAFGILIVGYRLFAALLGPYAATLMSICCCGCVEPNEISGGFGGSWEYVGEAFEHSHGDDLGQIIYFFSWDPVFYCGCGLLLLAVLLFGAAVAAESQT